MAVRGRSRTGFASMALSFEQDALDDCVFRGSTREAAPNSSVPGTWRPSKASRSAASTWRDHWSSEETTFSTMEASCGA